MSLYAIRNLTRVYGERTVVDLAELAIEEGSICALLGANGAGKSTLFRILAFLEPPTSGEIRFLSRPVRFVEAELRRLRRQVVLLGQHPVLFTTSVHANLDFGLKIRKIGRAERHRRIAAALDLVGMADFRQAAAQHLSGGETQRVALARALALSPRVLLCDEPTAGVDAEHQGIILDLLRRIHEEQGITVLFTTHDHGQAAAIARRTLTLDRGRLAATDGANLLAATVLERAGNRLLLGIGPHIRLWCDTTAAVVSGQRLAVVIDPGGVLLLDGSEPEAENLVVGRCRQIIETDDGVRITVDAGVGLAFLLPMARYRQLRPLAGDLLRLRIPAAAVRFRG
ncbi:MAG: ABC transporter ATP-binding protein [Thermodesulfobacteriota bacterium]